jgi:hypothetical protein
MKHSLIASAVFVAALGVTGLAQAQTYSYYPPLYPPFQIQPAMPETMPTWSPSELSGTSHPTIAATPDCGAANPQGGIPSMATGTCP